MTIDNIYGQKITLYFDPPLRRDNGCILLPLTTSSNQYNELREDLLHESGRPIRNSMAHITLFYPRNSTGKYIPEPNFQNLSFPMAITFDSFSLIEQTNGQPWKQVNEYPLCTI